MVIAIHTVYIHTATALCALIHKKSHNNHYHQRNVLGEIGIRTTLYPYMLDKLRRRQRINKHNIPNNNINGIKEVNERMRNRVLHIRSMVRAVCRENQKTILHLLKHERITFINTISSPLLLLHHSFIHNTLCVCV